MFRYKGYEGSAAYSCDDAVFHGKLLDIRALINYEAETEQNLERAFQAAVDDYLGLCVHVGLAPEQP